MSPIKDIEFRFWVKTTELTAIIILIKQVCGQTKDKQCESPTLITLFLEITDGDITAYA